MEQPSIKPTRRKRGRVPFAPRKKRKPHTVIPIIIDLNELRFEAGIIDHRNTFDVGKKGGWVDYPIYKELKRLPITYIDAIASSNVELSTTVYHNDKPIGICYVHRYSEAIQMIRETLDQFYKVETLNMYSKSQQTAIQICQHLWTHVLPMFEDLHKELMDHPTNPLIDQLTMNIVVLEPYRHQGVGRKLLEFTINHLRKCGYDSIVTDVAHPYGAKIATRLGGSLYENIPWSTFGMKTEGTFDIWYGDIRKSPRNKID